MSKISTHKMVVEMQPCNPAIFSEVDTKPRPTGPQLVQHEKSLQDYPLVLTPTEAAQALGIGKNSIYALLRSGALGSIRVGKLIKIPRAAIEEYLQQY